MKVQRISRLAAFAALAVLVLTGWLGGFSSAAGVRAHGGHTGQALALRAALRGPLPLAPSRIHNAANGRYVANLKNFSQPRATTGANGTTGNIIIDEAVQTFDVFSPPPTFTPTGPKGAAVAGFSLVPTNLFPVWSRDETFIVFSSNRTAAGIVATDGRFHLWAVAANGGGAPVQITTSTGPAGAGEFYPALTPSNNVIAFTSDANSAGTQNLYQIAFNANNLFTGAAAATSINGLASITIRSDVTTRLFGNIQRPTFSPANSDMIVFSAFSNGGTNANHYHLYFLFFSTGGFDPAAPGSLPAKLTDGPADDTDPAFSPDGQLIAYASTATGITSSGQAPSPDPNVAPTLMTAAAGTPITAPRTLFLINSQGLNGVQLTQPGTDNFGPAWSSNLTNIFTNDNSANQLLAWGRSAAQTSPHDIYYMRVTHIDPATNRQTISEENSALPDGTTNNVIKLNTDDNAGQTSAAGNVFDDTYPTWAPFQSIFSIAYSSNRSVTYNDPNNNDNPSELAISIPSGGAIGNGTPAVPGGAAAVPSGTVAATYTGILESQVLNLDPPTFVPFSSSESIHINQGSAPILPTPANPRGSAARLVPPGQPVTFTVRLSNREAGVDDANVYMQIKDPDSKYQDSQGLEHKTFAKDIMYYEVADTNGRLLHPLPDSGTSEGIPYGTPIVPNTSQGAVASSTSTTFPGPGPFGGRSFLLNGVGNAFTQTGIQIIPTSPPIQVPLRGSVAGWDKLSNITLGRAGGGSNIFTNPQGQRLRFGSDPRLFIPWGPEFECQFVNPQFGVNGPDTTPSDYGTPFYLAGVDDQQPFGGFFTPPASGMTNPANTRGILAHPPRSALNFTTTTTDPATGKPVTTPHPAEYLQMNRSAQQDNFGGTLYTVTWIPPASTSDFYLDVIAYDKAVFPALPQDTSAFSGFSKNFRIYDNIYGFTTQPFNGSNDILVVGDYSLGQKFAASSFGGQNRIANLVPKIFGTESYVTDIDVNLLPDSTYIWGPPGPGPYFPLIQPLSTLVGNGLGVASHVDGVNDDGGFVIGTDPISGNTTTSPNVASQRYSLYRILSRGPVPQQVLSAYLPRLVSQPAVVDPGAPTALQNVPASSVEIANRCVIWQAPYTGDLLVAPGTLADPATQASLRSFVGSGGRMFLSGPDVGSTLTLNGSVNAGAGGFLNDVLNATLTTPNAGSQVLASVPATAGAAGTNISVNRVSISPFFDGTPFVGFPEAPGTTAHQNALILGNNVEKTQGNPTANWRADAALSQLGPNAQTFTNNVASSAGTSQNSLLAQIDTITPTNKALGDIGFNGVSPAGPTTGAFGLIYQENPLVTNSTGAIISGTGSRVIYGSFGIEGVSTDINTSFSPPPGGKDTYNATQNPPGIPNYYPNQQRQNLLHNVVCYLRTGTFIGTVRQTTGNGGVGSGLAGAVVYLVDANGVLPPQRATFSATTDQAGNYRIDGVEPGTYTVAAFKNGFLRATSNAGVTFTVEGDTIQRVSLTINPLPPGTVSGTVTDTSNPAKPIVGALVTLVSKDGQITLTATTDTMGNYRITNVPVAVYTGVATKPPQYGASPSQDITVIASSNTVANFQLPASPGAFSGRVYDVNTNAGIPGATVTITGGATPVTVKTDANGNYASGQVPSGTYQVTASAAGFATGTAITVVVTPGATVTGQDIGLSTASNGTLGGLVTTTANGAALTGVTITATNTASQQVFTTTTAAPTTPALGPGGDGQPVNYLLTLPEGPYTVKASKTGYTTTTQSITVAGSAFTRLDFTGGQALPPLHVFQAGLSFFSLPQDYSGVSWNTVLGPLNTAARGATPNGARSHIAVWNPQISQYVLDPTPPADSPHIGQGYWVYLYQPTGLTVLGTTPTTARVSVSLHPLWNQIGVPSQTPIAVSNLQFAGSNGTALSFAQATSSNFHVVSPILYRFDGLNYQPVGASDTLQPYQAYWIKVFVDTTIMIPTR